MFDNLFHRYCFGRCSSELVQLVPLSIIQSINQVKHMYIYIYIYIYIYRYDNSARPDKCHPYPKVITLGSVSCLFTCIFFLPAVSMSDKHSNCLGFAGTFLVFGMLSWCPWLNHFVPVFRFLTKKNSYSHKFSFDSIIYSNSYLECYKQHNSSELNKKLYFENIWFKRLSAISRDIHSIWLSNFNSGTGHVQKYEAGVWTFWKLQKYFFCNKMIKV